MGKLVVIPMEGGSFSSSGGTPRAPQGPQWFQIDNLVFHERSIYNILICDNLTMGKLGVSPMDNHLLFHENSRNSILPWKELTMGKLGFSPIEGG